MINDILNPKLFEDNKLKENIRIRILQIVDEFKHFLEIPINVLDIRLVGSNANYNYTEYSDIDVHLVVNFDELSSNNELIQVLFDSKRKSFNSTYDINIKGINVELYVEDVKTSSISNGIYSILQNCWIKFPHKPNDIFQLPDYSELYNKYRDMCETVLSQDNPELVTVEDLINKIYMLRKNGLAISGEFSKGNLVFKELRNQTYIEKLMELKNQLLSNKLSLENFTNAVF